MHKQQQQDQQVQQKKRKEKQGAHKINYNPNDKAERTDNWRQQVGPDVGHDGAAFCLGRLSASLI